MSATLKRSREHREVLAVPPDRATYGEARFDGGDLHRDGSEHSRRNEVEIRNAEADARPG